MGRSQKWSDLWSQKEKFRDIGFVDTDTLITLCMVHVDPLRTIVAAQSKMFWEDGSLDLTWWSDLRWPWAEIFRKGEESMHWKVCKKNGGAACRRLCFFLPNTSFRKPNWFWQYFLGVSWLMVSKCINYSSNADVERLCDPFTTPHQLLFSRR